jgi:GMP synthase (glutamine-hydrolysing)
MKPFLILQHRPIDEAADNELEAFMRYGDLKDSEVHRIRMEEAGIPPIDLNEYSAVICGGGPSNVSDPEDQKPDWQRRFESDLNKLYPEIIKKDFPFMGACYGIGSLTKYLGGEVSGEKYAEEVGSTTIHLSDEAKVDPLTKELPNPFMAFVGHKEACQNLPKGAVLLASSDQCPIQMMRLGKNVYSTQFHPELDNEGLALRIYIYKDHGYFEPGQANSLIDQISDEVVTIPNILMKRFVERYRR